jgi:hypothetical protein
MPISDTNSSPVEALRRYNRDLAERRVEDDPVVRGLQVAKRIVWMITLAGAFLFYYLIDKMQEALSILG